jgi:hypothetical protein
MGLLDDAIREHLELKRRHGADPSEVERQEHEALGPARRGAAPPADADAELESGAVSVGMLDEDDEPDAPYDDEPLDEPEPSVPAGEPEAPVAPPAPAREPEDRAEVIDEAPAIEHEAPAIEDEPPSVERRAEAPPAGEPAAGEDVLEETPDFLQETPEHDRLWFEQKPPRDFEF